MAWHGGVSKFNNPDHHKSICYDTWAESHHQTLLSLVILASCYLPVMKTPSPSLPIMHATVSPNNLGLSKL